jgi:hypothetical protein
MQGSGSYHIKGNHIVERDFTGFVALDQMFVDQDGTASSRQAQDEGSLGSRVEGFDAVYVEALADCETAQRSMRCTNDIVRDVLGRSLRIVSDD